MVADEPPTTLTTSLAATAVNPKTTAIDATRKNAIAHGKHDRLSLLLDAVASAMPHQGSLEHQRVLVRFARRMGYPPEVRPLQTLHTTWTGVQAFTDEVVKCVATAAVTAERTEPTSPPEDHPRSSRRFETLRDPACSMMPRGAW